MFIQVFLKDCPDMLSRNETIQDYANHVDSIDGAKLTRAILTSDPEPGAMGSHRVTFFKKLNNDDLYRIKANAIILTVITYGFCLFACLMVTWLKAQYIERDLLTMICIGSTVCSLLGAGLMFLSYKSRKYKSLLIRESKIFLEELQNTINIRREQQLRASRVVIEPTNVPPRRHERILQQPASQPVAAAAVIAKEVERWDTL